MFGRCVQQIATDWVHLIIASLGTADATNFLGSIAFLLAIASKLIGLGFAGTKGSALVRSIVMLAVGIWLLQATFAHRTHIAHGMNNFGKCIHDTAASVPL
jgi:hypothetical protein